MLTGDYLIRPDFAAGAEILASLLMGALLAFATYRSGTAYGLAFGLGALVTVILAAWLAYARWGWLIDPVLPVVSLAAVYATGTIFLRFSIERERNQIRHAFARYMSPAQVEKLAADPASLELGGEDRTLTLLFADVRSFAEHSEGMDAQQLTRFVIDLFTPLSDTILRNNGTIDKFIGDAVMAFWNAPLADPKHAANACRAALTMLSDLNSINERRRSNRLPTDCDGYRSQHRRLLRGEFWLHAAVRLFGDRERRQSCVTLREPHEVLRTAHRRWANHG